MKRNNFHAEMSAELVERIDRLADRLAPFGWTRDNVVEQCLFFGLAKVEQVADHYQREQEKARNAEARALRAAAHLHAAPNV